MKNISTFLHMRNGMTCNCYKVVVVLLLLASFQTMVAQNSLLYGQVVDKLTNEVITNALVTLTDHNSNIVDSVYSGNWGQIAETKKPWAMSVRKMPRSFTIKVEKEGYDPVSFSYDFKPYKRKANYLCPIARLSRSKEKQLDEVVVKATKVMFYSKGDTLVFNADAFRLAEGSMLDALVRQMPGVELTEGVIYVNGKKVDNLLLNGDDFFKGRNDILLDNLPNYMVNQVKVYDKTGKLSEIAGHDMGDKEFVMDVVLKKQYRIGWIGNVEGGCGTEDRYLARLFPLRYTQQSRVSIYGNINNVNESRKPGGNGDWSPSNNVNGQEATRNIGMDYMVKDRNKKWEVNGNVAFAHRDYDGLTSTSSTIFTPSRNTNEKIVDRQSSDRTSFSSNHTLFFRHAKTQLWVMPRISLQRQNNYGSNILLGLSDNLFGKKAVLDSLATPTLSAKAWGNLTHRSLNNNMGKTDNVSTGITINVNQGFSTSDDILQIQSNVNYNDTKTDKYNNYLYEYQGQNEQNVVSNRRNRYTRIHPDSYLSYRLKTMYWIWFPNNLAIIPWYRYWGARKHCDYDTYRLDALSDWSMDNPLGRLPSVEDLHRTADGGNSYDLTMTESEHTGGVSLQWEGNVKKGRLLVTASLPARLSTQKLEHLQTSLDTTFRHTTCFFEPELKLRYQWDNWTKDLQFNYNTKATFAQMENFVPYTHDENPLQVYLGGSNLRNSYAYTASLNYYDRQTSKGKMLNLGGSYSITQDKMAYASLYNLSTGVRTYRMINVNGNYTFSLNAGYSLPLNKKKTLSLSTNTSYRFYNNVDYVGEINAVEDATYDMVSGRSKVKTSLLEEKLDLKWRVGQNTLRAFGSATWHSATGSRDNFKTISAIDCKYGLAVQLLLPWGIGVVTDITMYSRRGYNSSSMNTDDLVWNAQLSKSVLRNRLTILVDGFDILSQLSSTTYSINGQGQKEIYQNVIPRYVMCRLIYKLNVKPKKRSGE